MEINMEYRFLVEWYNSDNSTTSRYFFSPNQAKLWLERNNISMDDVITFGYN